MQVGPATYTLPEGPTIFSRLAGSSRLLLLLPTDTDSMLRSGGTRSFTIDLVDARIKFIPTAPNVYETPAAGNSSNNATIARRDPFFDQLIPIIAGKIDDIADKIKDKIAKHRDGRQNAPGGARRLYSATPTIGSIVKLTNANRDGLTDGGEIPYSDMELAFDGSFDMPGNRTQKGFVNNSTNYRFLIRYAFPLLPFQNSDSSSISFDSSLTRLLLRRALKNSGDAALESNYESWLSSPVSFPNAQ